MLHQNFNLENESNKPVTLISDREKEILILMSYGITSKNIAKRLHLSVSTIETHRKNLLLKLECNNVANLIRRGFELNILTKSKLIIGEV